MSAWAVAILVAFAVAACGPKQPAKPTGPTPQQLAALAAQKAQEEQAEADRVAAEQDALEKLADQEAAQHQQAIKQAELPKEFGTPAALASSGQGSMPAAGSGGNDVVAAAAPRVNEIAPVYVPQKLPPPEVAGATPYDKAFPPIPDNVVRVGIVSGSSQAQSAQDLARMLSDEDRKYIEETLGQGVKVAYVSETDHPQTRRTRVMYRPQYFKAAVQIAALLPQPQQLATMNDAEAARHGVDVLVQVGTDLH